MHNLSDEELDKIFQDAAAEHKPVYNPEDWDRLATRLDVKPTPFVPKSKYFLIASLLFFVAVFIAWNVLIDSAQPSTEVLDPIEDSNTGKDKVIQSISGATPTESKSLENRNVPDNVTHSHILSTGQMMVQPAVELTISEKFTYENNETGQYVLSEEADAIELKIDKVIEVVDQGQDSTTKEVALDDSISDEALNESRKLLLKLALSPDLTSLQFFKPGKPGFNAGVAMEYYLGPAFSISTGIYYTKKSYNDPDPEGSYGGGYYYPNQKLEGTCSMLEIPVNLYVHFNEKSKTNFYLGTGFSSYIMMNELYTFKDNYNSTLYQLEYDGLSRDWLAVLNISLGVTRSLTPYIDFQVEPYYKAPLKQLGEGKMRLNSAGAFFNLRYKLL